MTTTNTTMNTANVITVKCGAFPGRINEYVVEPGTTVERVLCLAQVNTDNGVVKVNGEDALMDKTLKNGDIVLVAKRVKGNL